MLDCENNVKFSHYLQGCDGWYFNKGIFLVPFHLENLDLLQFYANMLLM